MRVSPFSSPFSLIFTTVFPFVSGCLPDWVDVLIAEDVSSVCYFHFRLIFPHPGEFPFLSLETFAISWAWAFL